MKYLIVISLLALGCVLIYWRLRPYIAMVRQVLGAVRNAQQISHRRTAASTDRFATKTAEKLIRCAACGVWLPATRALTLQRSSSTPYCSSQCLEQAGGGKQRMSAEG